VPSGSAHELEHCVARGQCSSPGGRGTVLLRAQCGVRGWRPSGRTITGRARWRPFRRCRGGGPVASTQFHPEKSGDAGGRLIHADYDALKPAIVRARRVSMRGILSR
jgi:hypothetical protein